jgi:energy-coupling factor transporter ATP-binding protein EcfA2
MQDALEKFRELTRVFDPIYQPRQAVGDGPGDSYVPETHEDYRNQLQAALALNDNAKLLVAGQPGCGKTTLLLSLADVLRKDGRIVAFVDLEAQTAVQDLRLVEMYVAALTELIQEGYGELRPETREGCRAFLARFLGEDGLLTESEAVLVSSLSRLLSMARRDTALREEMRRVMKQGTEDDPFGMLCRALDDLAGAGRRPVVILDGLDKLPPDRASKTFLDEEHKPMAEAPGAAILTIPLSVVYEPTFNVLSGRYNNADSAVLPAVRLWDFDPVARQRTRSQKGIDILRRIVKARLELVDPEIVLPKAVDRAIEGSGGNIRELARLVQASVVKAYVRKGSFIEPQDIEAAIADQRESFRRGYDPSFRSLLMRVREEYTLDESSPTAKQLLYGLWIIEYRNGHAWYSLPEPVELLLEHLERARP